MGAKFGLDFRKTYQTELESLADMVEDGLVALDDRSLEVLPKGEPLLRVMAMAFDQTLNPSVQAHASTV
ncbi:MAG: hypothetical protein J6386_23985 [Candidatus Synoicihabitans palmerolidicus]|nr:hypothetical protein [Candidatus Synoicihabitans palmerolidicus]